MLIKDIKEDQEKEQKDMVYYNIYNELQRCLKLKTESYLENFNIYAQCEYLTNNKVI